MIDTRVEGEPGSVRAVERWLRSTLAAELDGASDDHVSARRTAAGIWEGETAEAHQGFTRTLVRVGDAHTRRVRRAADSFGDYATRLERHRTRMEGFRSRARAGGLSVTGTAIQAPPDVPATVVAPGSPEEAEHQRAVAKVELYDELAGDVATARENHTAWIASTMPSAQADAEERDDVGPLMDVAGEVLKNFGTGLAAFGMRRIADGFRERRNELRRTARRSGNPARRADARSRLPDATRNLGLARRLARFAGPVGLAIDVGLGIYEGHQTGDYTRAALTTGAGLLAGAGVVALIATAPVSVPALAVVAAAGAVGWAASEGVGWVYDNWDDITDNVSDAWDSTTDAVSDGWDSATDAVGDAWDSVTPW